MGFVFLLMGKTYSYKKFIKEFCENDPKYNCSSMVFNYDNDKINIMLADMKDYEGLRQKYESKFYVVYVNTPNDQILHKAVDATSGAEYCYKMMCERFVEECDTYSEKRLKEINAHVIDADSPCDACCEFIKFVESMVEKWGN